MNQRNSITGLIAAYAGGLAEVVTAGARAPITASGSFSVPVSLNPSTVTLKLSPPPNSPYQPLSLSVTLGPGATDVSAEINGALSIVGTYIGVPGHSAVGTNEAGYAVPGSGGGGVPGGSAGQIQYNNAGAFGGAGLTNGSHFALGVGAALDSVPTQLAFGDPNPSKATVTIKESPTSAEGEISQYIEQNWSPAADLVSNYVTAGQAINFNVNLDGQSTGDSTTAGLIINVNSLGNTTSSYPAGGLTGQLIAPQNLGDATMGMLGTSNYLGNYGKGTVLSPTAYIATLEQDDPAASVGGSGGYVGFVTNLVLAGGSMTAWHGFVFDGAEFARGAGTTIGDVFGFRYKNPVRGSTVVTNQHALLIEDVTGATTDNYAIKTGLGKVEFGDTVQYDKVLLPGTVYSAAGTPLPAPSMPLLGARAVVSDATLPTFLGAYVSGGAVVAPVFCDGTAWVTA